MWPVEGWQRPLVSITVTILAAAPFWLKAEARLSKLRRRKQCNHFGCCAILAQGRGTPEQVGEETATYGHLAMYEASAEHYVQVSLAPYQQELK